MQNSYFVELLSKVASNNILGVGQGGTGGICPFSTNFDPLKKNLSTCSFILFFKYQVMKILLNNLLHVRRVTKEGEFYNKYLD